MNSRRPDLEIRATFFTQLTAQEQKLKQNGNGAKSTNWNEISDDPKNIESEELLLRNTFLNSKVTALAEIFCNNNNNSNN